MTELDFGTKTGQATNDRHDAPSALQISLQTSVSQNGNILVAEVGRISGRQKSPSSVSYEAKHRDLSLCLYENGEFEEMWQEFENLKGDEVKELLVKCLHNPKRIQSSQFSHLRHFKLKFESCRDPQLLNASSKYYESSIKLECEKSQNVSEFLRNLMRMILSGPERLNILKIQSAHIKFSINDTLAQDDARDFFSDHISDHRTVSEEDGEKINIGSSISSNSVKQKCLNLLELAYPNPLSSEEISRLIDISEKDIIKSISELQHEHFISEIEKGIFLRQTVGEQILEITEDSGKFASISNNPKVKLATNPTIGIIISSYSDKVAIDCFLKNKTTYRHRCENPNVVQNPLRESSSTNLYTAGVWQSKDSLQSISIVTLKVPFNPETPNSSHLIASGLCTRLCGRFPTLKQIIFVPQIVECKLSKEEKSSEKDEIYPLLISNKSTNPKEPFKNISTIPSNITQHVSRIVEDYLSQKNDSLQQMYHIGNQYLENQVSQTNCERFGRLNSTDGFENQSIVLNLKSGNIMPIDQELTENSDLKSFKSTECIGLGENLESMINSVIGNGINDYCIVGHSEKFICNWKLKKRERNKYEKFQDSLKCASLVFCIINNLMAES
ncbi:MAG: hypothetical protein MHMPM18_001097 [Marteilia pararefringens]